MKHVELMTVEKHYHVARVGLILEPDFSVPDDWRNIQERVLVVAPDGSEITAKARLNVTHFNLANPSDRGEHRSWRVIVSLLGINESSVPVGSRVLVSAATHHALLGADVGPSSGGWGAVQEFGAKRAANAHQTP